jgi:hypothetical protein
MLGLSAAISAELVANRMKREKRDFMGRIKGSVQELATRETPREQTPF